MLVTTRTAGQDILIHAGAATIVVKVLGVQGRRVRLGVEAPPAVRVERPDTPAPPETPRQRFERLPPSEE